MRYHICRNKPCMQLVLWKPQSEILINAIDNNDDEKKPATENMDNIDTRLELLSLAVLKLEPKMLQNS